MLADRLTARRTEIGLSQHNLAKKAGVTRVAISKAEQGLTKSFNGDTLFAIAKALNCDPEWLLTGKGNPEKYDLKPTYPIIEWSDLKDTTLNRFWLRVIGDAMISSTGISFPDGMLILVDRNIKASPNSYTIVAVNGIFTFKQLVIDTGIQYFKSLNPNYPLISSSNNECLIFGVIVEAKLIFQN